jgi:peptidoglycan/xylan/chitin deacetylase (PgdA/CDA1 family)
MAFRWSGVLCLSYHRVGDAKESLFDRDVWSAGAEAFDKQVRFLKSHAEVVGPDEVPDPPRHSRDRFVLLAFDDGYRDNYDTAFPILRGHGVCASFFVATGYVDHPRLPWWDEIAWMVRSSRLTALRAGTWLPGPVDFDEPGRTRAVNAAIETYKRLPSASTTAFLDGLAEATGSGRFAAGLVDDLWMTWDMLREMRRAGMTIGGHTVNHPVLANLTPEEQWQETSGCAGRLAAELGEPMRYFSYPVGQRDSFNEQTRACLTRLGVRFAFSYYGGYRRFDQWDPLDVRRLSVERHMDLDWVGASVALPGVFGAVR